MIYSIQIQLLPKPSTESSCVKLKRCCGFVPNIHITPINRCLRRWFASILSLKLFLNKPIKPSNPLSHSPKKSWSHSDMAPLTLYTRHDTFTMVIADLCLKIGGLPVRLSEARDMAITQKTVPGKAVLKTTDPCRICHIRLNKSTNIVIPPKNQMIWGQESHWGIGRLTFITSTFCCSKTIISHIRAVDKQTVILLSYDISVPSDADDHEVLL